MNEEDIKQKAAEELTKKLMDEGKLIAAGWEAVRMLILPPNATMAQVSTCRKMFYLGAEHLYSSMMSGFDEAAEETEQDMKKMEHIHNELMAFRKEVGA